MRIKGFDDGLTKGILLTAESILDFKKLVDDAAKVDPKAGKGAKMIVQILEEAYNLMNKGF